MVVSRPKRVRVETGSVWKEGSVDSVVRTALCETGGLISQAHLNMRNGLPPEKDRSCDCNMHKESLSPTTRLLHKQVKFPLPPRLHPIRYSEMIISSVRVET